MKRHSSVLIFASMALMMTLSACGSRQLVKDMPYVSNSSDPVAGGETAGETKAVSHCHFSVLTIPLGTEAAPENAFAKLAEGAHHINHLELKKSGWSIGRVYGRPLFGRTCWDAKGRVVKEQK